MERVIAFLSLVAGLAVSLGGGWAVAAWLDVASRIVPPVIMLLLAGVLFGFRKRDQHTGRPGGISAQCRRTTAVCLGYASRAQPSRVRSAAKPISTKKTNVTWMNANASNVTMPTP